MANTEAVLLWVEALRSGGYTQAKGRLFDKGGYCCLGVLSDVYLRNVQDDGYHHEVEHQLVNGYLPHEKVAEWLGIPIVLDLPDGQQTIYAKDPEVEVFYRPEVVDSTGEVLPEWRSFDTEELIQLVPNQYGRLINVSRLNDFGHNFDFASIADAIERTYLNDPA